MNKGQQWIKGKDSFEDEELRKAIQASKEAEELRKAIEASKEAEELRKAIEASKEAEELRQALLEIEKQDSKKEIGRKPIIPLEAWEYINPSSLMESYALQEIGNDVRNIYIPPPNDKSIGIVVGIIQYGIVTYAFVVENEDGSYSVIRINEISKINGIARKQEKPDIGDSVFWVKKDSGQLAGGGTAFQFPDGTSWRSTSSGYRWTDSNGIEQSRLYLS